MQQTTDRTKSPVTLRKQLSQVSVWQSHTIPEWQPTDCPKANSGHRGNMEEMWQKNGKDTWTTPVWAENGQEENQRCELEESSNSTELANSAKNYSMKFARPKKLLINEYPDVTISHPDMIKHMIQQAIFPEQNTDLDKYLNTTIDFLKKQKSDRAKKSQ